MKLWVLQNGQIGIHNVLKCFLGTSFTSTIIIPLVIKLSSYIYCIYSCDPLVVSDAPASNFVLKDL